MAKNLSKLLITPNDLDCNNACGYCYNGNFRNVCKTPNHIISMSTIAMIFSQISPYLRSKYLTVVWHGGEPLLAGKDFYKEVFSIQQKYSEGNYKIINAIQTNGTLIDEEWVELFKRYKVGPSVSVDGPANLHNKIRIFSDGTGTYQKAMEGYNLIRDNNVNCGLLMVITKYNIDHPDEIWKWIVDNKVKHMDFLPCAEPELIRNNKRLYSVSDDKMLAFSKRLFDLWFSHDNPDIKIRTFIDAIKGSLGGQVAICSWKMGCLQHISFDSFGNAFPCARYHCYPETSFGNIVSSSFQSIMEGDKMKSIFSSIAEGQSKCQPCQWKSMCGSGCPFMKYAIYRDWSAPYIHCNFRKQLFSYIQSQMP